MERVTQRRSRVPLRLVALVVSMGLALVACSASTQEKQAAGNGATGSAATLEFPNFQGGEAPFSTWWTEFIKAYEKKYPNVTVKTTDVQQSNSYADVLMTRLPAQDPPDVIQMTTTNFARLAAPGWLQPLDDLLKDTNVPTKWGSLQDSFRWQGKTLGVMTLVGATSCTTTRSCSRMPASLFPLRLSKAGLTTSMAFSAVIAWSDFLFARTLITDRELWPVTVGLASFLGDYSTNWNAIMALGLLSVAPLALLFIFTERFLISGLTAGSVKG